MFSLVVLRALTPMYFAQFCRRMKPKKKKKSSRAHTHFMFFGDIRCDSVSAQAPAMPTKFYRKS